MKTRQILAIAAIAVTATCSMSSLSHAAAAREARAVGSTKHVNGTSYIKLEAVSSKVAIVTVSESMALKNKPFARDFSVEATWKLVATGCRGIKITGPTMVPAQTGPFAVGPSATTSCVANQTVVVFSYQVFGGVAGSMIPAPKFAVDKSITGLFRVELSQGSSFVSISTSTKMTEYQGGVATSKTTLAAATKL